MIDDPGYEGEGDFAMHLWLGEQMEADRIVRSHNIDDLRAEAVRLYKGGRYKYVGLYRWDYDKKDDSIVIEEFGF